MTRLLLLALMISSLSQMSYAQLEENNMVLFAKANVLMESGRYDEAVRMYNTILKADENHMNALYMRAKAKYELGAFKGTKIDMMKYIEAVGVDKRVLDIMAPTELQLGNLEAAANYANSKLEMDPFDDAMFITAGDIAIEMSDRNNACEHYSIAANLGSSKAKRRISEHCDGYTARKRANTSLEEEKEVLTAEEDKVMIDEQPDPGLEKNEDGVVSLEDIVAEAESDPNIQVETPTTQSERTTFEPEPTEPEPTPEDDIDPNASQSIEIDDMLSISVADGLGDRPVASKPNIFMLSDQDGVVVIDLCVDERGRVTEAVFNRNLSTIYRSSLTSLALRKAKEFVFESKNIDEQCGRLTYHIKS